MEIALHIMYFRGLAVLIIPLRPLFRSFFFLVQKLVSVITIILNRGREVSETLGAGNGYGLWEPGGPSTIVLVGCPLGPVWKFVSDSDRNSVLQRSGSWNGHC